MQTIRSTGAPSSVSARGGRSRLHGSQRIAGAGSGGAFLPGVLLDRLARPSTARRWRTIRDTGRPIRNERYSRPLDLRDAFHKLRDKWTARTLPGVPTLQVITRACRNAPVPMTLPTTTDIAAISVRPRTRVGSSTPSQKSIGSCAGPRRRWLRWASSKYAQYVFGGPPCQPRRSLATIPDGLLQRGTSVVSLK